MVYVSHSVPEIMRLADTIVLLADGKCLAAGPADELLERADLGPVTGGDEATSLIETRIVGHDAAEQLTTLGFDGGRLFVPQLRGAIGDRVRATLRARDVSLALQRPAGISILNVLPGRVTRSRARTGRPSTSVSLSVRPPSPRASRAVSLRELNVHVGQELFALVKAVSFDQSSVGYADTRHAHETQPPLSHPRPRAKARSRSARQDRAARSDRGDSSITAAARQLGMSYRRACRWSTRRTVLSSTLR
jgi:molybdate transport system ATP-binding protein